MRATRQQIQETFSAELQTELRRRYRGRIPSAAGFAVHFNLQIRDPGLDISQETARRWLRGQCLPDATRMRVLSKWLGLDLNRALSCDPKRGEESFDRAFEEMNRLFARIDPRQRELALNLLKRAMPDVLV